MLDCKSYREKKFEHELDQLKHSEHVGLSQASLHCSLLALVLHIC